MESKIQQRIAGRVAVVQNNKVLIIRESSAYKTGTQIGRYDMPGGKIKPGESLSNGLIREVKEECGLTVKLGNPFFVGEWHPIINGNQLQIIGIYFLCSVRNFKVKLGSDHDDFKWIDFKKYDDYDLVPPNKQVIKELIKYYGK